MQKRPVDLLDVDPAVLYWLERVGGSTNLRAATSGSAKGRGATNFILTLVSLPWSANPAAAICRHSGPMSQNIAQRAGSADDVKILKRIQGVRKKAIITLPH